MVCATGHVLKELQLVSIQRFIIVDAPWPSWYEVAKNAFVLELKSQRDLVAAVFFCVVIIRHGILLGMHT